MSRTAERHTDTTPYVFVSYASADRARVLPLVDALTRAGVGVWIDRDGIHGGENYAREIADAIEGCAALVLMTSAASLGSRNVKQEIALAWEYERPYVPLLLEPVEIPKDVKYWLTAAQWIEVLNTPERAWLPQVLAALEPLGIAATPAAQEEVRLAGRDKELALLRDKLADAREGTGGLALIGGEAGIGKTTLAEAVLRGAATLGCALLEGHCFDLAETPPYGPWIDLFLHVPHSASLPPLPEAFAERGTVGAVASQMALFAQVEDFLRALAARQPVVILLDDLHWSDPASLDLLRFLTRSVAMLPLLLLVTYRSDELTRRHPLYQLLPQLARDAGAVRLDLTRLDDDAVRALVDARYHLPEGDSARLATYLQGRAEGNVLFVGELLRSLEEADTLRQEGGRWVLGDLGATAVPALLRQVIDGRLGRLDAESQRLLTLAAIIGQEVPLAVWVAVAEADEESLFDLIERAEEANLLAGTPDGAGVRFAHALIREALYESVPSVRRRRLHRRAGEALAGTRNPDPDAVAMHFQKAVDSRAVEWLVKAGERAREAHAYVTAVERMKEAVALLDGPEHAALAGGLALQIGYLLRHSDRRLSIQYTEEAIPRAAAAGDPVMAAAARCRLGTAYFYEADYPRAIAELRAGVEALEGVSLEAWEHTATPPDVRIGSLREARTLLAFPLAVVGANTEAQRLLDVALDDPDGVLATLSVIGLFAVEHLAAGMGRPDIAARAHARSVEMTVALEDWQALGISLAAFLNIVVLPYHADDPAYRERVADEAERAFAKAQAVHLWEAFPTRAARFHVLFIEGAWAEAEALTPVARRQTGGTGIGWGAVTLAELARARGRDEEAWEHVRERLPQGAATPPMAVGAEPTQVLMHLAARLALDAGDLDGARQWAEASDRWMMWSGAVLGQSERQAIWARYHRQMGDTARAFEHAERALAHATEPRQPLALLAAHRLLGELDTDAGRHDDAARHFDESLQLTDACEAPYERALTLLALAELRAATGDTEKARTLLDEVRAICEPLGATPVLARAAAVAARLARA